MADKTRLSGGKELTHLFEELPKRVATKGLRAAMSAAASPIVKEVKADTPQQSGLLKKSETKKIKTYQGGTMVVAVIGSNANVDGEYKGKKRVPVNYFHLVEEGHAGPHPAAGKHMLAHAYESHKEEAGQIALDKLRDVLEAEAAKGR